MQHPIFKTHHTTSQLAIQLKEVVFGMEDGMVSTLGAITGIAVGSQNRFVVLLSGLVIISVESISMAVGTYISKKAEKDINVRKTAEENIELDNFPEEEKQELKSFYVKNGWPEEMAGKMALTASQDRKLMLREMLCHEIGISKFENHRNPIISGLFMFLSYVLGGLLPILPYFIFDFDRAILISFGLTMFGLFALGAWTTRFSKRNWFSAGFELLVLAGLASGIGFLIGHFADKFLV